MNNSRTQGSAFVVIIVILAIALVGALGFLFWQNFNQHDSTQTAELVNTASEKAESPEVNQTAYVLADAVKGITQSLAVGECNGEGTQLKESDFIVVSSTGQFTYQGGKSFINEDLTYAYVQYGCGSQGVGAFVKKDRDVWRLVNESARIYPLCDDIRGHGFPSSVVDKCYDGEQAAEPVKL